MIYGSQILMYIHFMTNSRGMSRYAIHEYLFRVADFSKENSTDNSFIILTLTTSVNENAK